MPFARPLPNAKNFLTPKRLRDYPRLFLATMIAMLLLNWLLGSGWMGAFGKVIGSDFIMFYTSGLLFRQDIANLYDAQAQWGFQEQLLSPTQAFFPPYNYPPYAPLLILPFTYLPLSPALAAWTILIVLCAALAVYWMRRDLAPASLINAGLSYFQLLILTLSFFPFIEGLQVGQNHGLTLLLITGILAFSIKERGWAAGVCAGLLLYKPHFAAGFVLLWLVWKNYRALAGFTLVALGWAGAVFVQHGLAPFLNYVEQVPSLMQMIYMDGFGAYLEVTPYGLLTSLLPQSAWRVIIIIIQVILALMSLLLLWYAWKVRKNSPEERLPAMILAILYPLLAAPHALLHDLIILIPAFILWARLSPSRCRLYLAVGVYLAAFLLPPLAYYSGAALLAFIPVGLLGVFLRMASLHLFHPPNPRANSSG